MLSSLGTSHDFSHCASPGESCTFIRVYYGNPGAVRNLGEKIKTRPQEKTMNASAKPKLCDEVLDVPP